MSNFVFGFSLLILLIQSPGEEDYYEEEDGQEADITLLTSLADAQRKRREQAAYQQLQAGGKVHCYHCCYHNIMQKSNSL